MTEKIIEVLNDLLEVNSIKSHNFDPLEVLKIVELRKINDNLKVLETRLCDTLYDSIGCLEDPINDISKAIRMIDL